LVSSLLLLASCGTDDKKLAKRVLVIDTEQNSSDLEKAPDGGSSLTSEQAYEKTVYALVAQHCALCHAGIQAPFFASSDISLAHTAVIETGKVNIQNVYDSRLVARLAVDEHHCWSDTCSADADEMAGAISDWIALAKLDEQNSEGALVTTTLRFLDRTTNVARENNTPGTLIWEAERFATIAQPMRVVETSSTSSHIEVPTGNGGLFNNPNTANIGAVTYQFTITEPGTYRAWGLVQAESAQNNSFYIRINNGAFAAWETQITEGEWDWSLANQNNGQAALTFNLQPGDHTMEIRRRRVATKLDKIAITTNTSFTGGLANVGVEVDVLEYDLASLLEINGAKFRIEIARYDAFSYKFTRPEIILPNGSIELAGLRVMINGKDVLQSTTYALIQETVAAPGKVLSSASMIVPFDLNFDEDEISFRFETLELK